MSRFYVAAEGFGWGIHDSSQGQHPNHPRVEYFSTRDHGSWTGAQDAATARCAEMNLDSTLDVESET